MSINIDAILLALLSEVEMVLTAAGIAAQMKPYRADPQNVLEVQLTSFGTNPNATNASGGVAGSQLEFVITVYAPAPSNSTDLQRAAEKLLNDIETAVIEAVDSWRGGARPWRKVEVFQKSRRPISPANLVQWRIGGIYLRVYA